MAPSVIVALLCLLATASAGVVFGVQVENLSVPEPAKVGHTARLECKWSGQDWYSIRWYKDDESFFTIISKTKVKAATDVHGVTVDVDSSNEYVVFLKDVVAATAGEYRCEVMGEKPYFVSSHLTKTLMVAAPSSLDLQCSTSCELPTNKIWKYEVGKTYTFIYSGKSSVSLSGKGSSNDQWSTDVEFTYVAPCNFAISIKKSIANTQVEKYPFVVATKNGVLDKICYHPEDDNESVNIKKGVASALQNSLTSFSEQPSEHSITE
ncbi:unnamed protein product, partial [Meganyctiphanes norvegica]